MTLLQKIGDKINILLSGIVLIPHFLEATRLRRSRVVQYLPVPTGSHDDKQEAFWQVTINTCQHPFVSWLYELITPTGSTKPIWLDRRYPSVSRVFTGNGHYWYEIKHGRAYGSGTWQPIINMLLLKQLIDDSGSDDLVLCTREMTFAPADH